MGHAVSAFLPPHLAQDKLNAAPILVSADTLRFDDLTVDEDESFAVAPRTMSPVVDRGDFYTAISMEAHLRSDAVE